MKVVDKCYNNILHFYETFNYFTLPLLAEHVRFGDVRSAEES
jgi:hypothetical protein